MKDKEHRIAPSRSKSQTAAKILQPKMSRAARTGHCRPAASAGVAVVQAHVSHGALRARINVWNVKLTAGIHPSGKAIQRKSANGVEAFQVPLRQKAGGLPLPSDVRTKMETAMGADFSDVRVHIGHEATSLGAIAYTWGTNIHFAPGQYSPHTIQGQKLLGHELWHVVQQRSGRVRNPFGGGVAVVQDHALEAEADRMGAKAAMTAVGRNKEE